MIFRFFVINLSLLVIAACTFIQPYKFDIPQGNEIEQAKLDQVQLGMSKAQVAYLLGNPAIDNPFDQDRWDYVYYLTDAKRKTSKRLISLSYTNGKLASIDEKYHTEAKPE